MKKILIAMFPKFRKVLGISLMLLFCVLVLGFSLRGYMGVPSEKELGSSYWKENGPFELSPERGRFALAYSVMEEGNLYFSENIAKFASPDIAQANGKYVSIFAP